MLLYLNLELMCTLILFIVQQCQLRTFYTRVKLTVSIFVLPCGL